MILLPQELFSALLLLERKRCERSGACFGLALLDVGHLADSAPVRERVFLHLRETDILGWYRDRCTMGIIFTALNGTPVADTRSRLCSKLREWVNGEVSVKLYIFPEDIPLEMYPELFRRNRRAFFHAMKRAIDVVVSLVALVVLSPVFLGIAMMVKLSSPGPVLFRQKRLGVLGRPFEFLKFRSMRHGNDPEIHRRYVARLIHKEGDDSGVYKIQNDPRITRVGRFLRKSSLDELPQFVNVLKGEMSLVGPRPPIPYELENYSAWHKRRVLEVKPGITGLWQVKGRSRTSFDEMVRLDIRYINQQSGWLDFLILLQTPRAVLSGTGAF